MFTPAISSRLIRGLFLLVGVIAVGPMPGADPIQKVDGADLRQRHSLASVEHLQKARSLAHTEAVAHSLVCVRTPVIP